MKAKIIYWTLTIMTFAALVLFIVSLPYSSEYEPMPANNFLAAPLFLLGVWFFSRATDDAMSS